MHHDVPLHVVRPGTSSSEKTWNFTEDWNTTALYPHGISFTRIFMDIYGYSWIFMDMYMFDPCKSILVVNKTKDNIVE